ncbi:MAG: hypothetical protein B0D92_01085 [Spirochaeta sp. LUC14_002_19_P3]|nr:MAG: hypothetical protein B0D92_01085 [Spirochaeta sp. LUC14_002_19_P3]
MREVDFLHYRPGSSIIHRHDPRFKLLELIIFSAVALAGSPLSLALSGALLAAFHCLAGTSLRGLRKPLLFWLAMALLIAGAAALAEPEPPVVLFGWMSPFGITGLEAGGLRALRLLAVLLAGQLLASTTDPVELAEALKRLLFFLPPAWRGLLAASIGLTVTFIPQVLDEAAAVSDAALSRGLAERRSIFRRVLILARPLAENTLRRAELIADAMLSRSFTPQPTPLQLPMHGRDWLLFAVSLMPLAAELGQKYF